MESKLFQQCTQLFKSTRDNVPPFIEIYSLVGQPQNLAIHALGIYKLNGPFTLNGLPIYKHSCFDLYFYYDPISNGFCVSYDLSSNNCILIFDIYNKFDPSIWDPENKEYVNGVEPILFRFLNEEPEVLDTSFNIPKRIKITSVGAFGQMV